MDIPGEDKKSLEASELLDQMLSDLERRRGMNRKMVAHPTGNNGSVQAPAAGKEELPATGTGPGDVLGKSDKNAQETLSSPRVFCPQDVRKSCMVGTVVTLITVPLSMVLCYVGFRWWKGKKHRPAPAPASQPGRPNSPSRPGSPRTAHFDSSQTWPQQQPQSSRKAERQHSLPPPLPPSPAVKQKPSEIPPPPPLPSQPPWSSS
ncbi:proline-rich receptor-like protein kinase PERK1 [Corvus hawaiiensis]|uniref:proline-rich receptor-like protein kinase PERK1 n=1 Tax=Corvus hawaiiensis TaxID=134902 RepID=UPI002018CB34|nr:proline-rich receptor-like protein kinase PERK1 [Corvus hawaiiensis]